MSVETDTSELTHRGITCYEEGNIEEASKYLYHAIKADSKDQEAWYWWSFCFDERERRVMCLTNAVKLNPDNEIGQDANKQLALLRLNTGDLIEGTVTGIAPFGSFVDIGVGKDALVHISELAQEHVTKAGDVVTRGETYTFKVIDIDYAEPRIGLSLRQAIRTLKKREIEPDQILEGRVKSVVDFGAFVDIGIGRDGLVHISELSEDRVEKVTDVLQEGDLVNVRVLQVDEQQKRISLTLRLEDNEAPAPTPPAPTPPAHVKPITATEWLAQKDITVQSSRIPTEEEDVWDTLALELGDNYQHLDGLLTQIRRRIARQDNTPFTFGVADISPQQRDAIKNFCRRLYEEYAILREYRFFRDAQRLRLAINFSVASNFFNGDWLERYIFLCMMRLLKQRGEDYDYLLNANVTHANERANELDLFFVIDGQPLWIECRTGDVADRLETYAVLRRKLHVPGERALVIGPSVTDRAARTMSQVHDVTITNLASFLPYVEGILGDGPATTASRATTLSPTLQSFNQVLRQKNLRPCTDYRRLVIRHLIDQVKDLQQPVNMRTLREELLQSVRTELAENGQKADRFSNSMLQNILLAVVRTGSVIDEQNNPSYRLNNNAAISRLTITNPDELEARCVHSYAWAILDNEPQFFDSAENCRIFEDAVKLPAPDKKQVAEIKTLQQQRT